MIRSFRGNAKLAIVRPEMMDALKAAGEKAKKGDPAGQQEAVQRYNALKKKHGVGLFTPVALGLIQAPFFMMLYSGSHRLCALPVPGLKDAGFLWFQNLTVADPYMILPVLAVVGINLTMRVSLPSCRVNAS